MDENSQQAIERALAHKRSDPDYVLHQGWKAVNDPNTPIPFHIRMKAGEHILRAIHKVGPDVPAFKTGTPERAGDVSTDENSNSVTGLADE